MKKGDLFWVGSIIIFSLFFIIPTTREIFAGLTADFYYPMSFIKFAILATMGELLAGRILTSHWHRPLGLVAKAGVWGFLGMVIALMFNIFSGGAQAAVSKGMLPEGSGIVGVILVAFYTSTLMNITFGPVLMAFHRVTDTWIDRYVVHSTPRGLKAAIAQVDWVGFIYIAVLKNIPFFWIPAHTLVFLLPSEYRVLASAYLSIVLGAMMAYIKRRGEPQKDSNDLSKCVH